MSRSTLNTSNPIALRYLMTETIFWMGEGATSAGVAVAPDAVETREETPGKQPEAPVAESGGTPNQPPQFLFYGGNKRHYLFLTQAGPHEWMSEPALDAFTKTLGALKLTVDDVAVLNMAKLPQKPAPADLAVFFNPKVVICLGVPFPGPRLGGITVFEAPSFDEMLLDAEKKRVFWTTIKSLLI